MTKLADMNPVAVQFATHLRDILLNGSYLYKTETGEKIRAMRPDELNKEMRYLGWKNTTRLDADAYRKMGMRVVTARYIGGARAKKFCEVVAMPKEVQGGSLN